MILAVPCPAQSMAQHIHCEIGTASARSMSAMTMLQGTTPLWSLDQYSRGQSVNAATDGTIVAVVTFGPTLTQPFLAATNQTVSGNGFLVQFPAVATNGQAWEYSATYQTTGGCVFWSGSGNLTIAPTTWTNQGGLVLNPLPARYTNNFARSQP